MTRIKRQQIYDKFNGLCAYTGKPLDDKWQVDHMTSKQLCQYQAYWKYCSIDQLKEKMKDVNRIENLMPAISIVNHYKRAHDIEGFRSYMLTFHKRIAKLPKKTNVPHTQRRKEYMMKLADLFDITPNKPFSGKFYFEQVSTKTT